MSYANDRELLRKLRGIAQRARQRAETFAEHHGFCSESLDMACAHGSRILFEELKAAGYSPRFGIHHGDVEGHVFIECEDFIIDITATQYRDPSGYTFDKVVIWSTGYGDRENFWEATHYANTLDELVKILASNDWCQTQIPGSEPDDYI